MGQGWARRQDLHRPGAARNFGLAAPGQPDRGIRAGTDLDGAGAWPLGRRTDRGWQGAAHRQRQPVAPVPTRRSAGGRHHHARLGAGDENRRGHRHQPRWAHLPCGDRRARTGHTGRRRGAGCQRVAAGRRVGHRLMRRRRHRPGLCRTAAFPRRPQRPERVQASVDRGDGQPRQPRTGLQDFALALRRRWPGEDGIHHQRAHQGAPDGAAAPRADRRRRGARQSPGSLCRLSRWRQLFHRKAGRRRRHHRRSVSPETGDRSAVRLQEQRIRRAAGRARFRAGRGKSDARFQGRGALYPPGL